MNQQWHDGTTLDDQLVAAWYRLKPERQQAHTLGIALAWLRRYPGAWMRVVTQDTDASAIAVQRHWSVGASPHPTQHEIAHVEHAARQAIAGIHGARIAPANVVPFRAAAATIQPETKRGPVVEHDA